MFATTVAGCASTHNLKTDGTNLLGGGFREDELRPGLYQMTAIGNRAPWPDAAAAAQTWKMRADVLCGENSYKSFGILTSESVQPVPPIAGAAGGLFALAVGDTVLANHSTSLNGYLLCNSAGLTVAEARQWLDAQKVVADRERVDKLKAELDALGGGKCAGNEAATDGERYYRQAKLLVSLERYAEAKECFYMAQKTAPIGSSYYRESCSGLGFLYEMGLGVQKDQNEAQTWYRKAGL